MFKRVGIAALLALPVVASAGEADDWRSWALGDRVRIGVGIFAPSIDTEVSASENSATAGTTIQLEQDLGLSDSESTELAFAEWRFFKRHSLALEYFDLERSANQASDITIEFGGETFSANVPIQSFFDINAVELNYRYSVLFDEKKDWYIGVGVAVQQLDFGLEAAAPGGGGGVISETVDTTAPLPTLRTGFSYALTDKWILEFDLGYLAVELDLDDDETFDGSVWTGRAGVRWRALDNLSLELAYADFRVDLEYEEPDLLAAVDYEYRGPLFGVSLQF